MKNKLLLPFIISVCLVVLLAGALLFPHFSQEATPNPERKNTSGSQL